MTPKHAKAAPDPGKRVLITGINGFVGSHLAELCAARGWRVFGTVRSVRSNLDNLPEKHDYHLLPCDLIDHAATAAAVRAANPEYVFHLAAQSFVPASWTSPRATIDANVVGTLHLLEAVRAEAPGAAVQVAGTSEEYGFVAPGECPITERQPLRPLSPYGVSKVAADMLARQFAASYGLRVVVTRAFNHSGPRRGAWFAESQWARAIALTEVGLKKTPLQHGNLEAVRDYTDVRDIVRGYVLALERGKEPVYNLGGGAASSPTMSNVLTKLVALARCHVQLELSAKFMRPSDVPRLVADASLAEADLGWKQTIMLPQMLADLLAYWREQVTVRRDVVA